MVISKMRLYITPKEAHEFKRILRHCINLLLFQYDIDFVNMIIQRIENNEALKEQGKKVIK